MRRILIAQVAMDTRPTRGCIVPHMPAARPGRSSSATGTGNELPSELGGLGPGPCPRSPVAGSAGRPRRARRTAPRPRARPRRAFSGPGCGVASGKRRGGHAATQASRPRRGQPGARSPGPAPWPGSLAQARAGRSPPSRCVDQLGKEPAPGPLELATPAAPGRGRRLRPARPCHANGAGGTGGTARTHAV
jgi:hypothetical protein